MRMPFELKSQGSWSYICFPFLETSGICHGFGTKHRDASHEEAGIKGAISAFSLKTYVLMNQEHGDVVHVIKDGERPGAGDGLLLLERNVAGIIKTADCLPIILYSTSMPVVAIVHAGWRGTALGIARKAARQMSASGVKPENIGALIGPGIGPCCYKVQEDVAGVFRAAGFGDPVLQRREDSLFLDLKEANIQMLQKEGVREVYDVGLCTFCREDLFYSARRDKGLGRQINFVLMRG
ncbi:MAG: peptidoglycan editing factor PgeF [Syntrophorhabdales bacterium]